jgi:excisionase family DNA binding protein
MDSRNGNEPGSAVQFEPIAVRIPEACRLTGIGRSKLYELIQSGEIATIKVGRITLIPTRGLRDFLTRCAESDR